MKQFGTLKILSASSASVAIHQAAANDTDYTTWVPQTIDKVGEGGNREQGQIHSLIRHTSCAHSRRDDVVGVLSSDSI